MKVKRLLPIFAAFVMSTTIFAVGCEFDLSEGFGSFLGGSSNSDNSGNNNNNNNDNNGNNNNHNTGNSNIIPEFCFVDQGGNLGYELQGRIAVLDKDYLVPGSAGEYQFIIKNDTNEVLRYGFIFQDILGNERPDKPFIEYRVQKDNMYLNDAQWDYAGYSYADIIIQPASEHMMKLQWRFLFEAGDDITYGDLRDKQFSINLFVWADINEEI